MRLRTADDLSPAELATAAIDMDLVLEREPLLSDNGFKQLRGRRPLAEHEAQFLKWREDMREPKSLAQFMAARGWLRQFSKIKALNRRGTSYGLKHCAEDNIGYVTNGVFIAAAIAEGFTVRRAEFGSPNAWFNISTEAWRHVERTRAEQRRRALIEQREDRRAARTEP
jgi:hypothetical protein